jgi:RNA polymerase sigma factor (TIGR02999 family)
MSDARPDVTTLLGLAGRGDARAQNDLFRLVESELRQRARARLRQERPSPNMQTTVLIDEAFLRLINNQDLSWQDRSQFYCFAARVMRTILVDDARQRQAEKRGGKEEAAPLDHVAEPAAPRSTDPLLLLALHDALDRLAQSHPDLIQLVELHHFGGWELKDIAEQILHVSYTTVKRNWQRARALLHRELSGGDDGSPAALPR